MKSSGQHLRAIAVLPFTVTIVVPTIILTLFDTSDASLSDRLTPPNLIQASAGGVIMLLGASMLFVTVRLFMRRGDGTLAPWNPTRKLVVIGVYRHVRNPMITGVMLILLGESILFGSFLIAGWFAFFVIANIVVIPIFEEPGLELRFGEDYRVYQDNVPRWIPRLHPWRGKLPSSTQEDESNQYVANDQ